jgi:hypothetical protein
MSWQLSFTASGDAFYPSRVALPFVRAVDPGEIASYGRYKGQPMPSGNATLVPPDRLKGRESLDAFCRLIADLIPGLRVAGADDFTLWVLRDYEHQCNEELSPAELTLIASLNCTLCYSAYKAAGDGV